MIDGGDARVILIVASVPFISTLNYDVWTARCGLRRAGALCNT